MRNISLRRGRHTGHQRLMKHCKAPAEYYLPDFRGRNHPQLTAECADVHAEQIKLSITYVALSNPYLMGPLGGRCLALSTFEGMYRRRNHFCNLFSSGTLKFTLRPEVSHWRANFAGVQQLQGNLFAIVYIRSRIPPSPRNQFIIGTPSIQTPSGNATGSNTLPVRTTRPVSHLLFLDGVTIR